MCWPSGCRAGARHQQASGAQPPRPDDIIALLEGGAQVVITTPPQWLKASNPAWPRRRFAGRTDPQDPPKPRPLNNTVAISLNDQGQITRLVLAGQADLYETPAVSPTADTKAGPGEDPN